MRCAAGRHRSSRSKRISSRGERAHAAAPLGFAVACTHQFGKGRFITPRIRLNSTRPGNFICAACSRFRTSVLAVFQPNCRPATWPVASNLPSLEDIPYTCHRRVNPPPNLREPARLVHSALFKLVVLFKEILHNHASSPLQPVFGRIFAFVNCAEVNPLFRPQRSSSMLWRQNQDP